MTPHVRNVFAALSHVDFNHAGRDDRQQVFMERLEIVAIEEGLKPAFVAGQSGHSRGFQRQLERFASGNGFQVVRTDPISAFTQLLAFSGHTISHSLLRAITSLSRTTARRDGQELLWMFKHATLEQQIRLCATGDGSMGDILGYPVCCTGAYLASEAQRMEAELDSFSHQHGAQTEAEFIRLYQNEVEPTGKFGAVVERVGETIRAQQARSIKQFPFVHFIACNECLQTPDSPASQLNKRMSELAIELSKTFARKFVEYSNEYARAFENYERARNA